MSRLEETNVLPRWPRRCDSSHGLLGSSVAMTTLQLHQVLWRQAGARRRLRSPTSQAEDVLQDVFAELREKRMELLGDAVPREAFPVRLPGGNWGAKQHGVPYASFQTATWTAAVHTFCNMYCLPKSAKYEISLYGEAGASTMCHAWSKKMQHLYSCFLDGGGEGSEFTEEHRCTDLGAEFEALAAGLVGRARMRADQLRDIAPVNPHML